MDKDYLAKILAILIITILIVLAAGSVAESHDMPMVFCNRLLPSFPSSRALTRNVEDGSGAIVYDSLEILTQRKDPMAVYFEIGMLQSHDDYEWLNAAIYLGACGRQEAVPYLIKALRHTALRSYDQEAGYLRALTSQNYGTDFEKWKSWWEKTNPDSQMDWNSNLGASQ
jgi:HEAT repeat protein